MVLQNVASSSLLYFKQTLNSGSETMIKGYGAFSTLKNVTIEYGEPEEKL